MTPNCTSTQQMNAHRAAVPQGNSYEESALAKGYAARRYNRAFAASHDRTATKMTSRSGSASIGVVMGSNSDWDVMQHACAILKEFGVAFEAKVVSAHRMPDEMFAYADSARARGLKAIIAGAGGAAHLPGMLASKTVIPVLGVPIPSKYLRGEDSLLSIVQMPRGVPVATFAIGEAGASNAALFAIAMLATENADLAMKLAQFRATQTEKARNMTLPL
jgi:5-(carboxyamino)imidazole ribonucleotide mutase